MSKKLKTLIVIDNLQTGGIATSLYNFLKNTSDYLDCDLLSFDDSSIDLQLLPANVNVLVPEKHLIVLGMSQEEISKISKSYALIRAGLVAFSRAFSGQFARSLLLLFTKKLKGYDLAIAYGHDNGWNSLSKGCIDFVVEKVEAEKKAVYIHCDYSNFGGYDSRQSRNLSKFDTIVNVSDSCTKSFVSKFPQLSDKCITCENFTDILGIQEKSNHAIEYKENAVNFVSVCRLSVVKGLDRAIKVFSELKKEGYDNFTWTIVGDGPELNTLKKMVEDEQLNEYIFFVGNQTNPFPYMKNASVFLLPSRHEAAPMVYGESAALNVPILTTKTCSAVELVENRGIGIVVDNTVEGIKLGIQKIIENPSILDGYKVPKSDINRAALMQFKKFFLTD